MTGKHRSLLARSVAGRGPPSRRVSERRSGADKAESRSPKGDVTRPREANGVRCERAAPARRPAAGDASPSPYWISSSWWMRMFMSSSRFAFSTAPGGARILAWMRSSMVGTSSAFIRMMSSLSTVWSRS
jgi:hypothetical protein